MTASRSNEYHAASSGIENNATLHNPTLWRAWTPRKPIAISIPEATSARSAPPTGGNRYERAKTVSSCTTIIATPLNASAVNMRGVGVKASIESATRYTPSATMPAPKCSIDARTRSFQTSVRSGSTTSSAIAKATMHSAGEAARTKTNMNAYANGSAARCGGRSTTSSPSATTPVSTTSAVVAPPWSKSSATAAANAVSTATMATRIQSFMSELSAQRRLRHHRAADRRDPPSRCVRSEH